GCRTLRRVNRVDQIVFVAGFVLHKEDVLAVAAPEVLGDGTTLVVCDWLSGVEGFFGAFDPNVSRAFKRLNKRNELSVWRDLCAGDFRVAEEKLAVNDWRLGAVLSKGRARSCRQQPSAEN